MPFFVGAVVVLLGQLSGCDVQHLAVVFPRLKAEITALVVKRIPGDVDWTERRRLFEQRPPEARPVVVHSHRARLRRYVSDCLLLCTATRSPSVQLSLQSVAAIIA